MLNFLKISTIRKRCYHPLVIITAVYLRPKFPMKGYQERCYQKNHSLISLFSRIHMFLHINCQCFIFCIRWTTADFTILTGRLFPLSVAKTFISKNDRSKKYRKHEGSLVRTLRIDKVRLFHLKRSS